MEIILFILVLSGTLVVADVPGTYIDVGVAVHATGIDDPEYIAQNPLANYEAGIERGRWTTYYRHDSSVPQWEYGLGFNQVGVKYRAWSSKR